MAKKSQDYTPQFLEVVAGSVDDQAKFFLRKFVLEFQGNFEEVLELCAEFKKYAPKGISPSKFSLIFPFLSINYQNFLVKDLPEFECHLV